MWVLKIKLNLIATKIQKKTSNLISIIRKRRETRRNSSLCEASWAHLGVFFSSSLSLFSSYFNFVHFFYDITKRSISRCFIFIDILQFSYIYKFINIRFDICLCKYFVRELRVFAIRTANKFVFLSFSAHFVKINSPHYAFTWIIPQTQFTFRRMSNWIAIINETMSVIMARHLSWK